MKKVLITGLAGFIGYLFGKVLRDAGYAVVGLDTINDYYDVNLKTSRLDLLLKDKNFKFEKIDLVEREKIHDLFKSNNFEYVVNLAAQAGVR